MRVFFPNSAFLGNLDPFLRHLDLSEPDHLRLSAHPRWISVHPVVLTMIAALGLTLSPARIECETFQARSAHYLERMGLFKVLGLKPQVDPEEHEPAGRFIPLSRITNSGELSRFLTDMLPLLHLEPIHGEPLRYVVSELVRNVLEHARAPEGALLAAQYYPRSNTVRLGIADTGVGIRSSLGHSHATPDHLTALRLALTPGITGTTSREGGSATNAGAGLFFIRSIAKVNRDFFLLYSGNAMYKQLKTDPRTKRVRLVADPFGDRHSKGDDYPLWQGTVVGIDISLDTTTELVTLLDQIHRTYVATIKERKQARFKRPRFV